VPELPENLGACGKYDINSRVCAQSHRRALFPGTQKACPCRVCMGHSARPTYRYFSA
jgi:hypothetical protein